MEEDDARPRIFYWRRSVATIVLPLPYYTMEDFASRWEVEEAGKKGREADEEDAHLHMGTGSSAIADTAKEIQEDEDMGARSLGARTHRSNAKVTVCSQPCCFVDEVKVGDFFPAEATP